MPTALLTRKSAVLGLPTLRSIALGCERRLLLAVTLLIVAIPLVHMAARSFLD